MKLIRWLRISFLGGALLGLAGCVSYPISAPLRQQAKPVSIAQVQANAGPLIGTTVIWGGRIIQTVNQTNGGSLYILQLPMDRYEQPDAFAASPGRFIARSAGMLDPAMFKNNALVTVAGEITGTSLEPLQQTQYAYPVLNIREVHIWHAVRPNYYYYPPATYWNYDLYGPDWGYWYGPGWRRHYYGPYRHWY